MQQNIIFYSILCGLLNTDYKFIAIERLSGLTVYPL